MPPRDPLAEARKVYADVADAVRLLRTESTNLNLTLHSAKSELASIRHEIADLRRELEQTQGYVRTLKKDVRHIDYALRRPLLWATLWLLIGGFIAASLADFARRVVEPYWLYLERLWN